MDESEELARYSRAKKAAAHFAGLPEEHLRRVMHETVLALYAATEDLSGVPESLHPADMVVRLQRGNIVKDGDW